ncbi:MAG: hypothetical protein AVDCRST_MAG27-138, partial [uncultured Craurococcus sp.]
GQFDPLLAADRCRRAGAAGTPGRARRRHGGLDGDRAGGGRLSPRPSLAAGPRLAGAIRHRRALGRTRPWGAAAGAGRDGLAGGWPAAPGPRRGGGARSFRHALLQQLSHPADAGRGRGEPRPGHCLHRRAGADRGPVEPALRPAGAGAAALCRSRPVTGLRGRSGGGRRGAGAALRAPVRADRAAGL